MFKVTGINSSTIELRNTDYYPIPLNKGNIINLMDSMGFIVSESDTLRFFPYKWGVLECQNSTISGHMFEDNNFNGLQEANEPGMSNRIVKLNGRDVCSDVNINKNIQTNASGYYEFSNIRAGIYRLSEEKPAGYDPTTPVLYRVILPNFITSLTKDFGNTPEPAAEEERT